MTDTRRIPAVGALLEHEAIRALLDRTSRPVLVDAIREATRQVRRGEVALPESDAAWGALIEQLVARGELPSLRRVLNATGVVLHTNLGRAPLAREAVAAVAQLAGSGTNLEYDLETGTRGSRDVHVAALLTKLTGAEDALVVNNCAAALVLSLAALSHGKEAVISRGELIEIGGSFRVPAIMSSSGARLREVGTTNRTHVDDYRAAIGRETAVLLKVHRSNFVQQGYVAEASVPDLAALASTHELPLLHDFGSGLMVDLAPWGLTGESTATDIVRQGADVVVMSADKLLGGPQAGIMLGRRDLIARCRQHPLARAMRIDKLRVAALEITLRLYRDPANAVQSVPVLAMLTTDEAVIRARAMAAANAWRAAGHAADVVSTVATVGGGAFPDAQIPSWGVALDLPAAGLEAALRQQAVPVVARVMHDRVLLDFRSLLPDDDRDAITSVRDALDQVPR